MLDPIKKRSIVNITELYKNKITKETFKRVNFDETVNDRFCEPDGFFFVPIIGNKIDNWNMHPNIDEYDKINIICKLKKK